MSNRPRLVVVAPIEPASTGNGLAMRVQMLVEAAARNQRVELVVVPVSGTPPIVDQERPTPLQVVPALDDGDHRALDPWLADPIWRSRLARLAPLPRAVTRVPLVPEMIVLDDHGPISGVLACRLTTSLLGLRLAEMLQVPLVVDLDDDDEALAASRGDAATAQSWHRVASLVLDHTHLTLAASAPVAEAIGAKHTADHPTVVPNAAPAPTAAATPRPGDRRVLMVANFDYPPNRDAARWLLDQVLPLLPERWSLDLVGPGGTSLRGHIHHDGRVRFHGLVSDLDALYSASDVAVAPLLAGSGSRIKVLEAFANRRPVVATTVGVDGLLVEPGHHVLVADAPEDFADAIVALDDPYLARRLVSAAERLVASTYHRHDVIATAARTLERAFDGERPGAPRTEERGP
ncbi:MAG: glycosyltransferase [Acidimicrobiales bacterium]